MFKRSATNDRRKGDERPDRNIMPPPSLDWRRHKLMKRPIPNELLNILVVWLSYCYLCVKWLNVWSDVFIVDFGVRQGSVLSPFLFAV